MPVIKCPSCNSMISSSSLNCPRCGAATSGVGGNDPHVYRNPHPTTGPQPTQTSQGCDLILCPECGMPSDSIKQYELPDFWLFLWVFLYHRNIIYTCCPSCMRKHIFIKGFTYNIITANLVWVLLFPWMIVQLIRSTTKGHSEAVLDMVG